MENETLWREQATKLMNEEAVEQSLEESFVKAVETRIPKQRYGLLLSGGVDSNTLALVCKQLNPDFKCYSVGFKDSHDLKYAQEIATLLGLDLEIKTLDLEELERITKAVVQILGEANVVKTGIGVVVYAALEMAQRDNITNLFGGLGAEEIFAGYQRHADADDINEECWRGLINMHPIDLTRDLAIANHFNMTLLAPFLDRELIKTAMTISGDLKLRDGHKKHAFREVAEKLGLPKEFCWRKKVAAQYGSSVDKEIGKLAKSKGFKYKKDYLESLLKN